MKAMLCVLSLSLLPLSGWAQEKIALEEAQEIAKFLVEAGSKKAKPAVKVDADTEKPFGMRHEQRGGMLIPDKKLSAESLANLEKGKIVPVGQLWLRNLSPVVDGATLKGEKLELITVNRDGNDVTVILCTLGARKSEKGTELVLLAKGKEPVLSVPMAKLDEKQELPLEFSAEVGEGQATLSINILGKFQGKVVIGVLEE